MLACLARYQWDGEHLIRQVADVQNPRYRAPHGGQLSPRCRKEVAADAGEQLVSARPAAAWHGTRNTVPSRAATQGSLASGRSYSSKVRRRPRHELNNVVVANRGAGLQSGGGGPGSLQRTAKNQRQSADNVHRTALSSNSGLPMSLKSNDGRNSGALAALDITQWFVGWRWPCFS